MVIEKIRRYIETIQRRAGLVPGEKSMPFRPPTMDERVAKLTGLSPVYVARLRRARLAEAHRLEAEKGLTETDRAQVKSKGEGMTPGTKSQLRRIVSMAAFVVAVYLAVAAYQPGNRYGDAPLSPGNVAAAVGFLCVAYIVWPKKQRS